MVIATVFLAIIGISGGFALGTEHRRDRDSQATAPQSPQTPDTNPVSDQPAPAGPSCPDQMLATARRLGITGQLSEVLQVRTEDTGLVVWICQDPAAKLYYQANRGGVDGQWVEGETALFLSDVEKSGDSYIATANDGATFTVSTTELHIVKKNGKVEDHPVRVQ